MKIERDGNGFRCSFDRTVRPVKARTVEDAAAAVLHYYGENCGRVLHASCPLCRAIRPEDDPTVRR